MKTDSIRKLVRTNCVTGIVRGQSWIFFSFRGKKKIKMQLTHFFLTVGQEIGNITFFFRPYLGLHCLVEGLKQRVHVKKCLYGLLERCKHTMYVVVLIRSASLWCF